MRLVRCFPALIAGSVLANGCGVVTSNGVVALGDAGTVADGSWADGGGRLPLDGGSCAPADVETYVPAGYRPPTAAWQGVCSADQIGGFYDACLGPNAGQRACSAFSEPDAGNGACAACVLTPDSASAYGPLVNHGTFITNNVAGCIHLSLPSELSCAKAKAALDGCELAACEANCPVMDAPTRAAYDNCASAADGAGCQSYAQMAACVQPLTDLDAGPVASCLLQSFKAFYEQVVPLFCGAPPLQDAGTVPVEGGTDGGPRADGGPDSGGHDAGGVDAGRRDSGLGDAGL